MKKATIKTILAIILMLLPLCISAIHIYKPISYDLHRKIFDALLDFYYFFTFFGGIYYALVSLIFLGKRMSVAFVCTLCGNMLYHAANWFTYFSYAKVDIMGSGISGMVAGYHLLTLLLLFDIVRFAKRLKQQKCEQYTEEFYEKDKKRKNFIKYGLSVYMLLWFDMVALVNKVPSESVWIAIMCVIIFVGYVLPFVHPFFLVSLSDKKEGCFKTYIEMLLLLLPYFLILCDDNLSLEQSTKWIVIAYEYMLTSIVYGIVLLIKKRRIKIKEESL